MAKKLTMLLSMLFLCIGMAFAQGKISGTVVSQEDGDPIVGASVIVDGTKMGTVTDIDGHFFLSVPAGKRLVVSYLGMKTQRVLAKDNMKITLEPDKQVLNEVVVTGMSKMDRRMFTGATDQIKADDALLGGVADISRSLEGRSAGVSVQNVSGTFGTAPKIRVRGATSIYGSSKPLWVVDGVIQEDVADVSADDLSSGDAETLISSAIAGLNSDDIESFQILKDGSATSIYGARAMSGVIVVTTKKGRAGQAHINYSGEFTTRLIPSYSDFNILNSQEQMGIYKEMRDKGWLNYSDVLNGSDYGVYGKMYELINTYNPKTGQFALAATDEAMNTYLQQAEFRNTNWFSELFSASLVQNHSISMSGGTEKTNYYVSMSAMLDPGWYKKSAVDRYTFNANATHRIFDNLSLNLIGGASYRKQQAPGTIAQDVDVVSGNVKRDFDINPYSYALNTSRALSPTEYYHTNYAPFNILNELNLNYIDMNVVDAKFQAQLNYSPVKGLDLSALGAIRYIQTSQEHHIKDNSNQAMAYRAMPNSIIRDANNYLYKDPEKPYDLPISVLPKGGLYQRTDNRMISHNFRLQANYSTTLGKVHYINAMAAIEAMGVERERTFFNGVGMQYNRGEIPFYVYQFFKKSEEQNSLYYNMNNTNSRTAAYLANATYSYKQRYTLNATYRYEGSNRMGKDRRVRWLPTWNLAGMWNAHEESWFNSTFNGYLSHLTTRMSYALTATPGPDGYTTSTAILEAYTPYRIAAKDKESGLRIKDLANDDLTYEKKHEFNLGVDAGFFNNRVNVEFAMYWRNNFDLIGPIATEGVGGQVIRYGNVAGMKSHGEELTISTKNIKSKDFSWDTNFIYSHNKTKITELCSRSRVIDLVRGIGFVEGYPARAIFSVPFVGLTEEGLPIVINEKGEQTSNDINFQERNNIGYLKYEGSADPKYTGSLGNIFTYKNFKLNVFITYQFGSVVRLDDVFSARYSDLSSMTKEFKNRWMVHGDEKVTNVPAILSYAQYTKNRTLRYGYNAYNFSDVMIAKGDFIRMKEVSLSYDFPKSFVSKTPFTNLSLKLQATNLFLIYADKKLNGQDPEFVNAGGVAAPMPKQFTLTVKFGL
jgi:TonB-linked SusC/RagA family outer membrane protein